MMKSQILLFLLISLPLKASDIKDIHLSLISSNHSSKTYSLFVGVDNQNNIKYIKTINNKKNKVKIYKNDILHKTVPLVKAASIELVTLTCKNFDPSTGCQITIKYPYNVIFMSFRSFKANLRKVKGHWGLFRGNIKFTKMHLIKRKVLGALIGVKKIEVSQVARNSSSYRTAILSQEYLPRL